MLKRNFQKIIALILLTSFCLPAFAQDEKAANQLVDNTKNDLLLVIGGGLAGAILGLSTLSFVEEPKKHTRNILVGASIGIIAGVAFVAFNQANKSRDYLAPDGADSFGATPKFNTEERGLWHTQEFWAKNDTAPSFHLTQVGYQFSF